LLAIGGWNEGSGRFSKLVANPETRQNLVRSAIKYLRQHQFDGLDLDWEYPASREGSRPSDRENYAQLVKVKINSQIFQGLCQCVITFGIYHFLGNSKPTGFKRRI
jgi:GH18 family chitinase